MSNFHFLRPFWLLALPPLLILLSWLWRRQLRNRSWQAVCDPELLPHLLLGRSQRRANWPLWLLSGGGLLAVLALAGPAWHRQPQPLFRQQSALVVMLDLSRSMNAADLKPNRLERARLKIEDLLRMRREGQTALIAFAGDAFAVTPLTDDTNTIRALLQSLSPDLMPVQGSEPQRAMALGIQLLQQAGLQRGQLLLITDEDRPESATDAARDLHQQGYKLSVLGIGTSEGAPIPLAGGGFLKDEHGDLVLPGLDDPGLQRLAAAGGGNYRHLSVDDRDLQGIMGDLQNHRLDKAEAATGKTGQRWREEGVWLLWPLVLLGALAFRRGWMLAMVLALVLLPSLPARALTWNELWQRPDQQAAKAFAAGQYEQAGKLFQDPRWQASALYRNGRYREAAETLENPQTADDWYNRGNALAQSGQLQQALQAYDKALELQPDHEDARFNREWVKKNLQQQQKQQNPQGDRQQSDDQRQQTGEQQPQQKDKQSGAQQQSDNPQGKENNDLQSPPRDAENKTGQNDSGDSGSTDPKSNQASQKHQGGDTHPPSEQHPGSRKQDAIPDTQETGGKDNDAPSDQATEQPAASQSDKQGVEMQADEAAGDPQQQANRQWLRRIPDDPGGLLRRKFLYQYRQRGKQLETDRPW